MYGLLYIHTIFNMSKYYCVEDELTEKGIKEMLEGFLSKKSRNKEINKPFIPIFEIEYKKIKKV